MDFKKSLSKVKASMSMIQFYIGLSVFVVGVSMVYLPAGVMVAGVLIAADGATNQ